jgi:hypothetical protein
MDMSGNLLTQQQLNMPVLELNLSEVKVIKRKTTGNGATNSGRKEEGWVERRRSGNNPHGSNNNSSNNSAPNSIGTNSNSSLATIAQKRKSGTIYLNKERSVSRTHFYLQRLTNEEDSSETMDGIRYFHFVRFVFFSFLFFFFYFFFLFSPSILLYCLHVFAYLFARSSIAF